MTPPDQPIPEDDDETPIPRGKASLEMLAALVHLTVAVVRVEKVAMALAAGLDERRRSKAETGHVARSAR